MPTGEVLQPHARIAACTSVRVAEHHNFGPRLPITTARSHRCRLRRLRCCRWRCCSRGCCCCRWRCRSRSTRSLPRIGHARSPQFHSRRLAVTTDAMVHALTGHMCGHRQRRPRHSATHSHRTADGRCCDGGVAIIRGVPRPPRLRRLQGSTRLHDATIGLEYSVLPAAM